MFASKSKALIPLSLLLCALPLALQQLAISKVRNYNDQLRAQVGQADHGTSASRRVTASVRKPGVSTSLDILVLLDEQKEVIRAGMLRGDGGTSRSDAFSRKLAALDSETLVRLIGEGAALRVTREPKGYLLSSLVAALAKKDARLAVVTAVGLIESDRSTANAFASRGALPEYFAMWAKRDCEGARAWLVDKERLANPDDHLGMNTMAISGFRQQLVGAMIQARSPYLTNDLRAMSEGDRIDLVTESLGSLNRGNAEQMVPTLAAYIPVIREWLPAWGRESVLAGVGRSLVVSFGDEYSAATKFFSNTELTPGEKEIIARSTAETILRTGRSPFDPALEARMLAVTEAFLQRAVPERADRIFEVAKAGGREAEFSKARMVIRTLLTSASEDDDQLAGTLLEYNLRSQLPEALKIAERIKDPAKRAATIEILNQRR